MDWNCTLTGERLSDVLDGTLAADQMAAFSTHAATCERCASLVAQVGGLVARIRELPPIDDPPFLASKIVAATRGMRAQEQGARGWFAWLSMTSPSRMAMGLVTVAVSFLIVFHAIGGAPHRIAFNPVTLYHDANRHMHLTYARGVKFVNDLRVVYVIQSRLASEPQPVSEPEPAPVTEPSAAPQQRPPDSDARPRSQVAPPAGRRATRSLAELAMLMLGRGMSSPPDKTSRSYL